MRKGFTLIELMIVVAIIAVIAAIAIPSLLRARQAANETNAAAACRSMGGHQAVWRRTDADGNGVQDYWCGDIRAFYAMEDGDGNQLKYIDVGLAKADFLPNAWAAWLYGLTYPNGMVGGSTNTTPKAGYFYVHMFFDENAELYMVDTTPNDGVANPFFNKSDWGVCAFPATYNKDGIRVFITNAEGVVYGADNREMPGPEVYGLPMLMWPDRDPTTRLAFSGKPWAVVQE
jgi:prepilin-type N-terminal cleavage/methylation domain-containing protein